jgi:L-Lysine epsilon oxidase N-terminal/L-lysine epsilon oxidase C-terminal domain
MIDANAISELKIYPPIGIARVGNANGADDYVIGPEVIGGAPTLPSTKPEQLARYVDDFRTTNGEIKRQAARFRIYAHMKDGSVEEVTGASATIEWRVVVANLKAGWYEFNQAMDLGSLSQPAWRRNRDLVPIPAHRSRLAIVPTPKTIQGQMADPVPLADGAFWDTPVYLGELRTDSEGRLIFLGGKGVARSFQKGVRPLTFANNPGWHDDVCDGPVRAQVMFPGHAPIDAEPGYVCVTPPNYAPGLFGLVTMDDVVREVFFDKTWIARPTATSFTDDVLPLFQRLTGLQWVNHGIFILHGFGSPLDAQNPQIIAKLNDSSPANAAWRRAIFAMFRDPSALGPLKEEQIPQIFGDAVDDLFSGIPQKPANGLLAVTKTQYAHLERWSDGTFDADWSPATAVQPSSFSALAPEAQVKHLERAPLHDCLGGPFHPAMEMTWVMRIPLLWKSAYRLNVLAGEQPAKQDFGDTLMPEVCMGANGPYDGAAAGCLTRFLGVPWQTDHTSCNSAADYFPSTFLSMPTFWGPRAPDQVLADGNYLRAAAIAHLGQPAEQQTSKHLMHRVDWLRDIRGLDYFDRLSKMIVEWSELGMVLPVKNAPASLPFDVRVEQRRVDKGEPIDVTADWKFLATENIENLFAPPTIAGVAQPRAARTTAPPPKRTYRQGEI